MKTNIKTTAACLGAILLSSVCCLAQPVWRTSGAAIGDTSIYLYNDSNTFVNWATASIRFGSPSGDSLIVTNLLDTENPNGVHIYFVDSVLNGPMGLDTTNGNEIPYNGGLPSCIAGYYFGVFVADTADTSNHYTATYYYDMADTFVTVCREPQLAVFKRQKNSDFNWTNANATLNMSLNTLEKTGEVYRGEYILSLGPPVPDLGPDTLICSNDNILLQPDTNCYIASYLWQDGSTNATFTATSAGTYWVQVTDSCGNTGTDTVIVSVDSLTASISGNDSICTGSSVTLTASGGTGYQWNTGATTASITVTPSSNTNYTVTVTDGTCDDTATVTVNVLPDPTASVSGNNSICTGSSSTLTASGGGNYLWSTGETTAVISVSPAADSTYSVIVSDSCGTDTAYISIAVNQPPTANISGNNSICSGFSSTLTATGGGSYLWNTGATTDAITVNPSADSTYSVIVSDSCGTDTAYITVTVLPGPNATAEPDTTIYAGESVQLNGTGGPGWSWYPGTGLSCINCQYPVATPEETTTYYLTVTDGNGCTATDSVVIIIKELPCGDLYVPNIFSPNGDGLNDVLYVYGNCLQDMHFVIYDRWGEKVFESSDVQDGWDGTFRFKPMDPAVFVFKLSGVNAQGEAVELKGNITLVR